MVEGSIIIQMVQYISGIGGKINFMEREFIYSQMVKDMMVRLPMASNMVLASITIKTGIFTQVSERMI